MATTNYVTLCNNAILESGSDLSLFATNGSDFTNPTKVQHKRFKKWVADAWRDLQQSAPDWFFESGTADVVVDPRINFSSANATGATTTIPTGVNYNLTSRSSTTEIFATVNVQDGLIRTGQLNTSVSAVCTGWVDLSGTEANAISFNLHEGSQRLYYSAAGPIVVSLYVQGWGSYDFTEIPQSDVYPYVRSLKQINNQTFRIRDFGSTIAEGAGNPQEKVLRFVPWESFQNRYDLASLNPGTPIYVTIDNEGRYRFYPSPNKAYSISFDYQKSVQTLAAYNDAPTKLPEEFVDLIMWGALKYYGKFDEQSNISNNQNRGRADLEYKIMLQRLEELTREKFHFKPVKLY